VHHLERLPSQTKKNETDSKGSQAFLKSRDIVTLPLIHSPRRGPAIHVCVQGSGGHERKMMGEDTNKYFSLAKERRRRRIQGLSRRPPVAKRAGGWKKAAGWHPPPPPPHRPLLKSSPQREVGGGGGVLGLGEKRAVGWLPAVGWAGPPPPPRGGGALRLKKGPGRIT